jgi:hypothetical protein
MSSSLEKILNLAKKTGDNVIVYNPAKPKDSYVILALNSYERLVEECSCGEFLTEDDLDDKINGEIEPWEDNWGTDENWDEDDAEIEPFLPEDIFHSEEAFTEEIPAGEEAEKDSEDKWEEEVNYLYPTEEEFASMAKEQLSNEGGDFNSISDILETKRDKKNSWDIPVERQVE